MKTAVFIEDIVGQSRRRGIGKDGNHRFEGDFFLPAAILTSERKLSARYYYLFYGLILLFFLFLLGRLVDLQIINGVKNFAASESNRLRNLRVKSQRGLILSRQGVILARNLPTFSIILSSDFCPLSGCDLSVLKSLKNFREIEKRYQRNKKESGAVVLTSGLSRDEILKIGDLESFPFLSLEDGSLRSYPQGPSFSHLLGYLGEADEEELKLSTGLLPGDYLGRDGLEKTYDAYLQGRSGTEVTEVDALGRFKRTLSRREPENGKSLKLAVDTDLQNTAAGALREELEKTGGCCGAVVVEDTRNGGLLALVSAPSFDNNLFSREAERAALTPLFNDPNKPFFNRAVAGQFAPGSIFKVVVGSGALDQNVVSKSVLINAPGAIRLGRFTFADWKPSGHGLVNIVSAIAESADTFFYQIGGGYEGLKGLGPDLIAAYARRFGFGAKTGLDLPEEAAGLVPDPAWKKRVRGEDWYLGNTYHFAIGQGDLLATPLQISAMTAALANGGLLYRPHLLETVVADGRIEYQVRAQAVKLDLKEGVLRTVREGMGRAAAPGGTAYPFFDFKVKVGAKTGTAEPGGEVRPNAWFTVFAPFDDPEIAVTVLVEHGGQGADVAAPVAKKILEEYFKGR